MRLRWVALVVAVVVVLVLTNILAVVYYLDTLQTPVLKSRSVDLTLANPSSWTSRFCLPVGTMFEFFWGTTDGSSANFTIWSAALTMPLQYREYAPGDNGIRWSAGEEMFEAFNVSTPSTQVLVTLEYQYNSTLGSSAAPPGGPC